MGSQCLGAGKCLHEFRGILQFNDSGLVPEGFDADDLRMIIRERFNMSLGTGLGKLKNRIFRIGHIGDFNDLMLMGTLVVWKWA